MMEGKILKIRENILVESTLPDGIYSGVWGGYTIRIGYNGKIYNLTTDNGVRGINIPVTITIVNGIGNFKEKNN